MSYSSTITIEELGADQQALRVLTLRGPGMPKQGASWGIESVVPTKWYPNNPDDATQQMLVTKEMPTRWEGMWHLTMLLRIPCRFADSPGQAGVGPQQGDDVTSPGLLVDIFDDLARKGRLLRVTWATDSTDPGLARTVRRLGRISRFEPKYKHSDRIDWECDWQWKSRGALQSRVTATRSDNIPSAASALQAAANAAIAASNTVIQSANAAIRSSVNCVALGQLEVLADAPRFFTQTLVNSFGRIVNRFTEVVGISQQIQTVPQQVANAAVDFARDTIDQGNQFRDDLSGTPAEQLTLSNNVADLLRSYRYFQGVDEQVEATNRTAVHLRDQIDVVRSTNPGGPAAAASRTAATGARDIIDVRVTRKGDTPMSLSRHYYGTVDHDVDILRANRMPWHLAKFAPGTIVVIPALATTRST